MTVAWLCLGLLLATPEVGLVQRTVVPPGKADTRLWQLRQKLGQRLDQKLALPARAVYVRAQDDRAQRTLRRLGVADAPLGTWRLARLSDAALAGALDDNSSLQLRAAPAHKPLSVDSLADISATAVQYGRGLSTARTGTGVLIGFVDTGIDLTHPAFQNADGTSRIIAVWDQDANTKSAPLAFGYGQECNQKVIDAGDCPLGDALGHGTHVAGIAAGSPDYYGVAPAADIAMVSSSDFTRLADAVTYLTQLADARGEPLVVNISVGGQYGPHDGRTPLEIFLDDMSRPGRIFVAAAGNDGSEAIHLGASLSSTAQRAELHGLPVGQPIQTLVELWSDTSAQVDVAVELWKDGVLAATLPLDVPDGEVVSGNLAYQGDTFATVAFAHDSPDDNGLRRHVLSFDRSTASALPSGGMFVLRLAGAGDMQGWISQSDYSSGTSSFGTGSSTGWLAGDGTRSIAVPATAPKVIAVGSYTVQTTWESEDEGWQTLPNLMVGALSSFSSLGPSGFPQLTGYKPDLCAPGSVIVSARAIGVPVSVETVSNQQMVMQGTSMAAPHVAGVVALMLEANPSLAPADVRDILHNSSRTDTDTGSLPNVSWGYGKLDALTAVRAAEAGGSGCAASPPTWAGLLIGVGTWALMQRRVNAASDAARKRR